jgi:rhodanese-related sulfurtransferase
LQLPDYSLAHASIENQIAWHYLDYRDPEKALPHAEAAATSYSQWGLETLATVDEVLQEWDKAESFYRASSERYSGCGSEADWYFFCRRTGKGSQDAAQQLVETALNNPNNTIESWNIILYRLLNKQTDQALEVIETEYKKKEDPWYGLLLVNYTDEKQDNARRDEILKALADSKEQALKKPYGERDKALFDLAAVLASDLADGGKAAFEQAEIEKKCPESPYPRPIYYYIAACYCDRHGKMELAKEFWQKAVTSKLNNDDIYRTLSAAALLEHGIGPEQYKDAWTTKLEKTDPK